MDRIIHHAEILANDGESYRAKETPERGVASDTAQEEETRMTRTTDTVPVYADLPLSPLYLYREQVRPDDLFAFAPLFKACPMEPLSSLRPLR